MVRAVTCFGVASLITGKNAPYHFDVWIFADDTQHGCAGADFDVIRMGSDT
jgi:hypothetical protein